MSEEIRCLTISYRMNAVVPAVIPIFLVNHQVITATATGIAIAIAIATLPTALLTIDQKDQRIKMAAVHLMSIAKYHLEVETTATVLAAAVLVAMVVQAMQLHWIQVG